MTFPITHFSSVGSPPPVPVAFITRGAIKMLSVEGNFGYGHWNGTNNFSYVSPAPYDRGFNTWALSAPASYITQMVTSGFNTMRIVIDPGPLVLGLVISVAQFNTLMGQIQAAIDGNTAAGLRTLVDLSCRPSTSVQATGFGLADTEVLSAATAGSAWVRYLAMVRAVAAWIVAHNNPNDVALEIFNEPPGGFTWASASTAMFAEARIGGGQNLTILIAGDGFASPTGLAALTASNYDANTMFVVHWYSPYQFCFQTQLAAPNSMQYVTGLEFPPNVTRQASNISNAKALISADSSLSTGQKTSAINAMTAAVNLYYSTPRNAAWVTSQLDVAQTWASGQSVASNRCIIGEFSANSASAYNYSRRFGADSVSLAAFITVVQGWCTTNSWNWGYFSGRDASNFGNGFTLAPGNVTPVYSDVRLRALGLTAVGATSPAFYVSSSGNDSNAGTIGSPFLTVNKAITAMNASLTTKTTYVRTGTVNTSTMALSAGQSLLAYPGDTPLSATIHITTPNTGPTGSNVTIKGLVFTMTGSGGMIQPLDNITNLRVLDNSATCTGFQNFLQVYNPGDGLRIQGNRFTSDTWNASGGLFPINVICNTTANHSDWVISDNTGVGGTFPIQAQTQGTPGVYTNIHCDRNNLTGWGSASSTVGSIGVSWVLSYNSSNNNNTLCDNYLEAAIGVSGNGGVGVEAAMAGCTYRNVIKAGWGYSLAKCPGSLYDASNMTITQQAFSNDGIGTGGQFYDGVNVEVRINTVNGVVRTGVGTPTNIPAAGPLPSATGLPTYVPSAPYLG